MMGTIVLETCRGV